MEKMKTNNTEGKPLRIHDLNIRELANYLNEKNIRTTQGKTIQPLHDAHIDILNDDARFKVLACGRRFGKCGCIDEELILADGSVETYGNLIGKEFYVNSVDENFKLIRTKATCVDNNIKPVYKVKTKYGLELLRTANHPLFTSFGWKSIEELKSGMRVLVPNQLPHRGKDRKNSKYIELLGLLLGDGCLTQKYYSFSVANPIIEKRFIELLDGTYRITQQENNKAKDYHLHINNSIYQVIEDTGLAGTSSHTKFIPNYIYTAPNDQIALFLNRLFATDGWVSNNEIGYCSVSFKLTQGVKRLLARLGIVSNFETKILKLGRWRGNVAYQLKIHNYLEIRKFVELVGILGKEDKFDEVLTHTKGSFNSQLNTIPKEFCYEFANKLKSLISYREQEKTLVGRVRPDRAAGRNKLLFYCDKFPEQFKEERKIINIPGYWDEIVSIEFVGEKATAGLSVPIYHNYISDCLEHNTFLVVLAALAVLMQMNRRVWIVAPDYGLCEKVFRELYSILVTQLRIIKPGKPGGGRARNQKGDYYLETPWGSVLEAKSMENPDSLAGEANDLVIVDEAALEPKLDDIWTQMLQPTLMDKEGSAIFISTPRGKNTFYKLFLFGQLGKSQRSGSEQIIFNEETGTTNDSREWSSFQKTSYDNPLLASSPDKSKEEIDSAYRRAVLSGKAQKFKQEYLADFESIADSCFPGFIEKKTDLNLYPNVIDYIWHPDNGPVYAACDHNFARPASTIFAQINSNEDIIIFDERFTQTTTSYMQAQQIADKEGELSRTALKIWQDQCQEMKYRHHIKFTEIVADISGKQRQLNGRAAWDDFKEVLNRSPVGLKQDRETGGNMIRLWMQFPQFDERGKPKLNSDGEQETLPKFFVSKNCVNTIYALSSARFKRTKNGGLKEDYEETPEGYEGLIDAIRYLMVYIFHDRNQFFATFKGF